jgi:hypothetical protein
LLSHAFTPPSVAGTSVAFYIALDLSQFQEFMRGRRRDPRFALSVPWEGSLRIPGDVIVERWNGNEVWVVSASPAKKGEMLTLDLTGIDPPMTVNVRVVESAPVLVDGAVRHGMRLAIVDDAKGMTK